MGILMGVEPLHRIEAEVHLIPQDRQQLGSVFPVFDRIDTSFPFVQSVFLFGTDLDPFVHSDRAFLK